MRRFIHALFAAAATQFIVIAAFAQDKTFTCQVRGTSFVLDDTDFDALKGEKITRQKFASFAPASVERANVCEARQIARLVKSGKIGYCDFVTLKHWRADYLSESEALKVLEAQERLHVGTEPKGSFPNCR